MSTILLISISLNVILILLGIKYDIFRQARKSAVRNTIKKTVLKLTGIKLTKTDFEVLETKIASIEAEYEKKYSDKKEKLQEEVVNALKADEYRKFIVGVFQVRGVTLKDRIVKMIAELMVNMYKSV